MLAIMKPTMMRPITRTATIQCRARATGVYAGVPSIAAAIPKRKPARLSSGRSILSHFFGCSYRGLWITRLGERSHQVVQLVPGAHGLGGHVAAVMHVDRRMQRQAADH